MMNKIFNFGKIDYNNLGKKNCALEVEVELTDGDKPVFSVSGNIWNHLHTDTYSCGQNLDDIKEYINDPTFNEIYQLWNLYHLNDLNAGTPIQEQAVNQWRKDNNITGWAYDQACEYLKSINLYGDKGYEYGTIWLYREIPEEDLNKIKALLQ